MVFLFYFWLLLWTLSKWRERKNLVLSFSAGVAALILAGEWMLPGWMGQFISAMAAYRHYAGDSAQSIIEMSFGHAFGIFVIFAILFGLAIACFRWRNGAARVPGVLSCGRFGSGYVYGRDSPGCALQSSAIASGSAGSPSPVAQTVELWESCGRHLSPSNRGNPVAMDILLASFFIPVRRWALPFYFSLMVPLAIAALLALLQMKLLTTENSRKKLVS